MAAPLAHADPARRVELGVESGVIERSGGAQAAGVGIALGSSTGPWSASLAALRWAGIDGSDETTWNALIRTQFETPERWRARGQFFVATGVDRRTSEMASDTAVTLELGVGAHLRITDHVAAYSQYSMGRRSDGDYFTKALFGLSVSP